MKLIQRIPNLFTLANLVCGVLAIILFIEEPANVIQLKEDCGVDYIDFIEIGALFIFLASIFDFLDGFLARVLKAQSAIGGQLDSLADLVTFGVAPGCLFYAISKIFIPEIHWLPYLGILIPAFSAYRLAKFNVDTTQRDYFKGLATPANALFWIGIGITINFSFLNNPAILIPFLIITCFLMVSNVKMFSLKIKNLQLDRDNRYRLFFLVGIIIIVISSILLDKILYSFSSIIIFYIFLSVPYHFFSK